MSTVALRGTLVQDGERATWRWKGQWAFGSSVAAAAAQSQQPFLYTFQSQQHPSGVAIPGLIQDEEDEEADDASHLMEEGPFADAGDETPYQNDACNESDAHSDPKSRDGMNDEATGDEDARFPETNPEIESTEEKEAGMEESKMVGAITKTGGERSSDTKPQSSEAPSKQAESVGASDLCMNEDVPGNTKAETEISPNNEDEPGDCKQDEKPKLKASHPRVTFATMGETEPAFTDAAAKYPDIKCPVSGEWKGYFQNVAGRPRDKVQKVQETFYLFLNGTPGTDVRYTFDNTPLPLTVHRDSLVHVRGMGTNPFGTFEIIGYLDMASRVLEIQRQYVLMPTSPSRRSRTTPKTGRSKNAGGSTRPKKSYFTRKRQPSWKRKSQEEQEEETQSMKRQRVMQPKKSKEEALMDGTITTGMPGDLGTTFAYTTTAISANSGLPVGESTNITAISTMVPANLPDIVIPGVSQPSATSVLTTAAPDTTTPQKTPPKRSSSGSVARKKRSSSIGSTKSTTPTIASTNSSSSLYLKLPPVGEPKKARWRAAHFLYYQRHDPELQLQQQQQEAAVAADGGKTSITALAATPNPKYVVYEGEMVNGQREGRGICLYSNGMLYEGQWKRNKEHGPGKLWTADRRRLVYEGDWERGRMQGLGTYYYYTPTKNGSNTATTNNATPPTGGSRYIGEFKENMRTGIGQYILPDGSVYDGMWIQGKMNGRGVFTWPDCSVYEGEFKDNQRHGQGLLKTSDGFVYDGMWVHNAMEGRGMAQYPNGQTYEGLFAHGRREGRGTMHFTNGAVYEGRFRDDAVDGQGTMKISRSLIVSNNEKNQEHKSETKDEVDKDKKEESSKPDFMIPISFQSDMGHIHTKAGFTVGGD